MPLGIPQGMEPSHSRQGLKETAEIIPSGQSQPITQEQE